MGGARQHGLAVEHDDRARAIPIAGIAAGEMMGYRAE